MLPIVEFFVLHRAIYGVRALLALLEKVRCIETKFFVCHAAKQSREHELLSFLIKVFLRLNFIILALLHFRV